MNQVPQAMRSWRILPVTVLIGCLVSTTVPGQAYSEEPPSRDQVPPRLLAMFERLRLALDRLQSVQYTAVFRRIQHIDLVPNAKEQSQRKHSLEYHVEFSCQGNLFRSRTRYRAVDGKLHDWDLAYNGQKYQRLEQQAGILELTANARAGLPTQYYMLQPIVFPFAFAFAEGDQLDYTTLLNAQCWQRLARIAKYSHSEPVTDLRCEVVSIHTRKNNIDAQYTVFLAEAYEYYPVRLVLEAAGCRSVTDVTVRAYDTREGVTFLPIAIRSADTLVDGRLLATNEYALEEKSVLVNREIDPSVFTIPAERAPNGVLDQDQNRWLVSPRGAVNETRSWSRRTLLAANAALLGIILATLLVRRMLRQRRSRRLG